MARLVVRPFVPGDVARAAALLRDRHHRDSTRIPSPSRALLEVAGATRALTEIQRDPHTTGVVAERDGRLAGFAFGQRLMLAPTDFASQFVPPHSISVPVQGHAVAAGEDETEVYLAMYAALSREWVDEGFFVHRWAIPAGDVRTQEALVGCGFGRYMTAAVRPTALPVPGAGNADIETREATSEDIQVVLHLAEALAEHHAVAPICWPLLPSTLPAVREFTAAMLAETQPPTWLGFLHGRAVAMQSFLVPGFTPPIVEQEKNVYLFEGMVEPDVQLGGIGAALLNRTMAWARDAGYERCTLHWASQNYSGGPFWLKHGFVPVEYGMERRVDERVAWARPRR